MDTDNQREFKLKCDICGEIIESLPFLTARRKSKYLKLYCDICNKRILEEEREKA